jgi:hypothetical protein
MSVGILARDAKTPERGVLTNNPLPQFLKDCLWIQLIVRVLFDLNESDILRACEIPRENRAHPRDQSNRTCLPSLNPCTEERPTSKSSAHTTSRPNRPATIFFTMSSLTRSSRTLLRTLPRSSLTPLPVRALSTSSTKRDNAATSSFDSPFKGMGGDAASKIPDFSHYRSKHGSNSNLVFQYFMVGAMGALTAAGAKATVQGMWDTIRIWLWED